MYRIQAALPALCVLLLGTLLAVPSHAQQNDTNNEQQTRRAEAVSPLVYKKIEEVQKATDEDDHDTAFRILNQLLERDSLSAYERALALQYLGILQNNTDQVAEAIRSFETILRIEGLEQPLYQNTRMTLAQLCMIAERYADAITYLEIWFSFEENPAPRVYALYAQALYQDGRYQDMIIPAETAIRLALERGLEVKEDWYALLTFAYFQNEEYVKLRDVTKAMIQQWPKEQNWKTLASTYAELNEEEASATTYSVNHLQGFLDSENELVAMAQLYMQRNVPYKAGTLLEAEMEAGRVDSNDKNFRLLAQAWSLAQEDEKALQALEHAASISDDGELNVRLGNAYLNAVRYDDCVASVRAGLQKGGVRNTDYAHISLGMCHYNLKQYDQAADMFQRAGQVERSQRVADQWIRVVTLDRQRDEDIAKTEAEVRRQVALLEQRREAAGRSIVQH